ncbi:MAG: TonB-dependent receptor [Termitinemataceae bacterium]|nr:MAG: TonB-dependent receptor [Termitinemataceae bacterium]
MKIPYLFTLAASCAALVLVPTALFAQDDDFVSAGQAKELVVTAGRTEEDVLSVAAQIKTITAEDIQKSGSTSVTQVLGEIAGVRFSGSMAGSGNEVISMRGFGENSFGRVLVLLDGNKINNSDMSAFNWNSVPLSDIERIEVLDGSASVQYGNNAVGGVINIITKKSGSAKTFIGISGGSNFSNSEIFSHSSPAKFGHYTVNGGHSGTNGYRQHQKSNNANASLAAAFNIDDTMTIDLSAAFTKIDMEFPGSISEDQFKEDPRHANISNFSDNGFEYYVTGGFGFTWAPDETFFIKTPLSYKWRNVESVTYSGYSVYENKQHSFEFRPQISKTFSLGSTTLRILGGADLYYANLLVSNYEDKTRKNTIGDLIFSPFTAAPYLTLRFNPVKSLSINAGVREDIAIYNNEQTKPDSTTTKKIFNALVYEGSVSFNPIKMFKIYGKYASLFRYPFTDELFEAAYINSWSLEIEPAVFNSDLKPEQGFNAEGGIYFYFKNYIQIDGNFFYMKLKDEITYVGTFGAGGRNDNFDSTQRLGTNINFAAHVLQYADITASYSFVKASFLKGDDKGNEIPLVPQHTFYGSLLGKIPVAGLSLGPDFTYKSNFYAAGNTANTGKKIDGYFLIGAKARLAKEIKGKEIAVQCTLHNIADVKYVSQVYWSDYYPDADMGRSFNISLQFRY